MLFKSEHSANDLYRDQCKVEELRIDFNIIAMKYNFHLVVHASRRSLYPFFEYIVARIPRESGKQPAILFSTLLLH